MEAEERSRSLRAALLFSVIACALAWLVVLPLWISSRGLAHAWAKLLLGAMMLTPAIAVLLATRAFPEPSLRAALGVRLGERGAWKYWLFAWLAFPAFCLAAPFVAAAFGLYDLDVARFSGFRATIEAAGGGKALEHMPIRTLVALQLAAVPLAPLLNAPLAFGEELGWRGYLLPKLMPLGPTRALLVSSAIWGLWHTPAILLGHNYPEAPRIGVLMMIAMCLVLGLLLGWTRLATGSVWPAVIGHGALNGAAGAVFLFHRAGSQIDTTQVGMTGWTGWLLPAAVILALIVARKFPVPRSKALSGDAAATSSAQR